MRGVKINLSKLLGAHRLVLSGSIVGEGTRGVDVECH